MIKYLKSIRMKIWLCVNVAFLGYLIATSSSLYTNSQLSQNLTSLENKDFPLSRYGSELTNAFKKQTKLYEDAFLMGEEDSATEGNQLADEIKTLLAAAIHMGGDDTGSQMEKLRGLQTTYSEYAGLASESYLRMAQGEELTDSQGTIRKLGEMQSSILKDLESVSKGLILAVEEKIQENKTIAYDNTRFQIILLCAVLILSAIIINLIANHLLVAPLKSIQEVVKSLSEGKFNGVEKLNSTSRDEIGDLSNALDNMMVNLQNVAAMATQIAGGNLDVKVKLASGEDELGLALLRMTENLNEFLGNVKGAGNQISSGSIQVSNSSQALSQGATEQASSLEEITSSVTQMASQTKLNAENATQASHLSDEARESAVQGNAQMQRMVAAMSEINESGKNISKIIKAIDEIAFQTNLLALNAAVEAARAGQHGKGFAVVAEEVRNLAARSAKAASETADLIEGSVKKAENGAQIATKTAEALEKIVSGVGKVSALVAEIAAASNEQAQGISQINQGLSQIDQVTQQNTANAEESAAAAEELSSQAAHLQHMLTRFRVSSAQPVQETPAALEWDQKLAVKGKKAESHFWGQPKPSEVIALDDREFGKY